jgi:biopolymer transport protein ExbD
VKLRRHHGLGRSSLDFTALVDIALVLVVFFLLSAQAGGLRSLPVALPQAGSGEDAVQGSLEVAVDANGAITIHGRPVEPKELPAAAAGARRVVLLADAAARHGRVVEVVDILRRAGVQEIYYGTARKVEDW